MPIRKYGVNSLYGSGPQKVADMSGCTVEEAKGYIADYFNKFSQLKRWIASSQEFIKTNGYIYSALGRKRRLKNVFSSDKGIAAHDIRSGINFLIQSCGSDVNLLATIDMFAEIDAARLDANIFMLVHDSIVAEVREDHVEEYCKLLKRCTQKDRGLSIPGTPIGIDQEIGDDYSFGKFEKVYGDDFQVFTGN